MPHRPSPIRPGHLLPAVAARVLPVLALAALLSAGSARPAPGAAPGQRAGAAPKSPPPASGVPALPGTLGPLTQRYLNGWYAFDPGLATRHGIHSGDDRMGGYTRDQVTAEIARLKALETELSAMKTFGWAPAQRVDYERLLLHIQARGIELDGIRRWERDPGYYVDILIQGVAGLMEDPEIPPTTRAQALKARLELTSAVLGAALENVSGPPKPWVQLALRNTEGLMTYLSSELPAALGETGTAADGGAAGGSAEPVAALRLAREAALRDLTSFRNWLKDDVLPGAGGTGALGTDLVARALASAEGNSASLARLEKLAVDDVANLKAGLEATARGMDATKSSLETARIYSIDHPSPNRLLAEAQRVYRDLQIHLADQSLVNHRDSLVVRILPNPAFARPLGPVRIRVSGPWEKRAATPAIYLSFPEPGWDDLREEDHLRVFSRYALPFMLMRFGEPGLATAAARVPLSTESRLNTALAARSTINGWGAHAEALMLESGYGGQDPRLRLFQLRSALLDATRFLAVLRIHTAGMTVEQATDYLQREGQLDRLTAEREALAASRGIEGMAPLLGRLMIVKLATDVRRARGESFTLRGFHEELLATGGLPLRLVRQRLLPGDKSPAL